MDRPLATLSALLLVLGTAVHAGSAEDPELTDPAGDQEVARGPLVVPTEEDDFADIDLVAAWFQESDAGGTVDLLVRAAEAWVDGTDIMATFAVEEGPTSRHTSTADGSTHKLEATVEGAQGTDTWLFVVRLDDAGAVGGDLLRLTEVAATRSDVGADAVPLTQDDQTGSDDAGPADRAFTVPREPPAPGVEAAVSEATGPDGSAWPLSGPMRVPEDGGTASLTLDVRNTGTDADSFTVASSADGRAGTATPATLDLLPGAAARVHVEQEVSGDADEVVLTVTSERGASSTTAIGLESVAGRTPVPAGLAVLTPVAEAVGFDQAFGAMAELVLLALVVLVVILLFYLLATLGRRAVPAAGDGPGPGPVPAATAPGAVAGASSGPLERQPIEPARPTAPRAAGAATPPSARQEPPPRPRRAPETLSARMQRLSTIRRSVDALGRGPPPAGRPTGRGRGTAPPLAASPRRPRLHVRVTEIQHDPATPTAGHHVRTAAIVHNQDEADADLRLVLRVDGHDIDERRLHLGPGAQRSISFRWTARSGPNDIRLEVREA